MCRYTLIPRTFLKCLFELHANSLHDGLPYTSYTFTFNGSPLLETQKADMVRTHSSVWTVDADFNAEIYSKVYRMDLKSFAR